jgi:hypothetical protein
LKKRQKKNREKYRSMWRRREEVCEGCVDVEMKERTERNKRIMKKGGE